MDAELCADPATLEGLGDRALVAAAKRVAYRLDPHAVVRPGPAGGVGAADQVRPAPDTMAYLTGLLPVAQAVACYAALGKAADALLAFGDPRTRGQLMADLAVERMTGQSAADGVPVTVHLVMTDRTLLQGDEEPAFVPGYGPVPAGWARDLVHPPSPRGPTRGLRARPRHPDHQPQTPPREDPPGRQVWLRRLYTHPATGELVALESRAKRFPDALREFLVLRDQTCRTPWCDAPVRHGDHVIPNAAGRCDQRRERSRPVRGVQLHQGSTRLGRPTHPRQPTRPAPGRDHHPHRAPLPIPTTTPTRQLPATGTQPDRGRLHPPHPRRLSRRPIGTGRPVRRATVAGSNGAHRSDRPPRAHRRRHRPDDRVLCGRARDDRDDVPVRPQGTDVRIEQDQPSPAGSRT